MLSKKDNDVLSHVGRGTPLGNFMRRYWHPIALSSQVAKPDADPLRVQLNGGTLRGISRYGRPSWCLR
jgi:phthalate 4,5-dioxygenase oxygenase subunit